MKKKRKKHFYGWVMVLYGILVMSTLHYTCFNSFGLFVVPVTESLGISRAAFSLTMTFGSISSILAAPLAGRLLAKRSVRKYMFFGIVISGVCILCESLAVSVWQFCVLTFLLQAASVFSLALPFSILMLRWFEENRSMATGMIFVGISLGGVLFAPPLTRLILAMGWRTAYAAVGLVILLVDAPLCLLLVRDEPGERETEKREEKTEEKRKTAAPGLFRKPGFWLLTAGLFCNSFGCVALYHIPAFIQSLGYTAEFAAGMVSFYSFINIFSKLAMGFLFDRFGLRPGVLFGVSGAAGCYFFMICAAAVPNQAVLFLFSFLFGIGLASQSMFVPSLVGGIYGKEQYSVVYGKISVFTLLAGGISNPLVSAVFDRTGSYRAAWLLCLAVSLLCGAFLLAVCRRPSGEKLT